MIGPGVSLSWGNVWPSDLAGGYGYRGYWEAGLSAYLYFQMPVFTVESLGVFRAGGRAGMSASLATYQYTTLTFFLPSVDISPFLSFSPSALKGWSFSFAVPARLLLRRDLAWSWSIGIELATMYTPGKGN
jgi:hypothetical protein